MRMLEYHLRDDSCMNYMYSLGKIIKGSGTVIIENRKLSEFHSVEVVGSIDVTITSGDNYVCNISGDDNIVPLVETIVNNYILEVSINENYSTNRDRKSTRLNSSHW